jgi:hypothetical protein
MSLKVPNTGTFDAFWTEQRPLRGIRPLHWGIVTNDAVHRLPEQIGMAVVPCVFLDHVMRM